MTCRVQALDPETLYGVVDTRVSELIYDKDIPKLSNVTIPGWPHIEQFTVFDHFIAYWSVSGDWTVEGAETFGAVFDLKSRQVVRKESVGPPPPGTDFPFFYNPTWDSNSRTVVFEAVNEHYKPVAFIMND